MKRPSKLSLFSVSLPAAFVMNLSAGMTHPDVISLQKILNSSPETRVAESGPGSPGNETSYFGSLTLQAVMRFQNKHVADILSPAGLLSGNGYVGPLTRKKLAEIAQTTPASGSSQDSASQNSSKTALNKDISNSYVVTSREKIDVFATDKKTIEISNALRELAKKRAQGAAVANTISTTDRFAEVHKVVIYSPSYSMGPAGTEISIKGTGFDQNGQNLVYFQGKNNQYVIKDARVTADSIVFAIPEIPAGRYDLAIKNKNGQSPTVFFVVTTEQSPKVSVQKVSQDPVTFGDKITLTGMNFTSERNEAITNMGSYANISSKDGKTLEFVFAPEALKDALAQNQKYNKKVDVAVYVVNDNGVSIDPLFFTFTF